MKIVVFLFIRPFYQCVLHLYITRFASRAQLSHEFDPSDLY